MMRFLSPSALLRARVFLFTLGLLAISTGCQLTQNSFVPSPLSAAELEAELLAVVPLGTSRDEALSRLATAGVSVEPGAGESVCYCDLWRRPGGEKWLLDAALYFDAEGKLYRIGPGQSETGIASGEVQPLPSGKNGSEAGRPPAPSRPSGNADGRQGERTPFGEL